MRSLVVAAEYPWPVNSGSRIRLSSTLRGLVSCGPTDLFSIVSDKREDFAPAPDTFGLERAEVLAIDDSAPSPAAIAGSLAFSRTPFELPMRARAKVEGALGRFAQGPYDLVWFFRVRAWVLGRDRVSAPAVVDLDDLEDQKILARLAIPRDLPGAAGALRKAASRLFWGEEIRRWKKLHSEIASNVESTVVCSTLDARRAGLEGVSVLPNGYPAPERPVGRAEPARPPTLLYQGTLRYPPNADAARFLVTEVAPKLRRLVDGVRIRLVGLPSPEITALHDPPAVTVVGQVPDITEELALADAVVVPLRFGSGTRVKVLEAFAHRLPVVSTTLGAEGLDVRNGTHLLVSDDASDLAKSCAEILTDDSLRSTLVGEAEALYRSKYEASVVDARVSRIANEAAGAR